VIWNVSVALAMHARRAVTLLFAILQLELGCSSPPCPPPRFISDGPTDPYHSVDIQNLKATPPTPTWTEIPGPLREEYERAHALSAEPTDCHDRDDAMGITEISIERGMCEGHCATYTLRLHADGWVEFLGPATRDPSGKLRGKLDFNRFVEVAQFAVEIGYFDLDDRYVCNGRNDAGTVFTVVERNGIRKAIAHTDAKGSGPRKLAAFEDAIDEAGRHATWMKPR
jgi:hypothetical protein